MGKYRRVVIAVGLAASALFIYLAARNLELDRLDEIWATADLFPWLPIGIASYLLGHVVRGQRCRLLVRREANLGLVTASNIVVVGYASNNVFPARLGEFARAGMLAERTGMPVVQSLAVTFIERVLDGLAILFLLVIATVAAAPPGWIQDLVIVAVAVFGGALAVIFVGVYSPGFVISAASRLGNKLGPKWHDRLVSLASSITNAGACLRDPRDAALLVFYSLLVWTLEAGLYVALLPVFGLPHDVRAGLVAMSVTSLGMLLPSSPGFIGPFHYFCSRAVVIYGADPTIALMYATLVHLAFYVPITLWGAGAMLWYGVEVGSSAAAAREARRGSKTQAIRGVAYVEIAPLSPPPPERATSAFTTTLVESIVVEDGHVHPRALADTAAFVEGELAALPPKLHILFNAGMAFFRFVTRLRYLRGYCELPLERRRRWTMRWVENRVSLFRQLFKPVRATALLAYYDHAETRRALLGDEAAPAERLVQIERPQAAEPKQEAEAS